MSNPPGVRHAIVDPSLLVSYSARVFIGYLAEIGGVVMVGNRITRQEEIVGLNNRFSRLTEPDAEQHVARAAEELERWRSRYRDAGLWRDVGPTDPEDEYLAETAVMCELDALLSANMHMIRSRDWDALMGGLGLRLQPALCRRGALVDWMLQEDGVSEAPKRIVSVIVGAMRPAEDLKMPLLRWAETVRGAFPKLSRDVATYLSQVPESTLQEQHRQQAQHSQHAVTRRYLQGRSPST